MPRAAKPERVDRLVVWVDDALVHLTVTGESTEAFGARFRLWLYARKQNPAGTLPDDDAQLATWAGLSKKDWLKHKAQVVGHWGRTTDGRYLIRRVADEAMRAQGISEAAREAALARWRGASGHADASPPDMRTHPPRESERIPLGNANALPPPAPAPAPASRGGSELRGDPVAHAREATPAGDPPPSRKRSGPSREPKPEPGGAELSPEQRAVVTRCLEEIFSRFPEDMTSIGALVQGYLARGAPWPPLERALTHAAQHATENAWGYLNRVLRVEEPNQHARAAEARGGGFAPVSGSATLQGLIDAANRAAQVGGASVHTEGE